MYGNTVHGQALPPSEAGFEGENSNRLHFLTALLLRPEHKFRCHDTAARQNLQVELTNAGENNSPQLSEASVQHLEVCEACHSELALWIEAARLCREDEYFDSIILAAQAGDAGIRMKEVSGGLALFKPGDRQCAGLLVVVDPDDWMDILAIHRDVPKAVFDNMS
ncbi:MAG TPA: hypothetical protein VKB88_42475 [Bryobacteraceae bacterium]|nr:hypothetical protein [Bryobacteraceae bacterium]